jgi:hypothetical protein
LATAARRGRVLGVTGPSWLRAPLSPAVWLLLADGGRLEVPLREEALCAVILLSPPGPWLHGTRTTPNRGGDHDDQSTYW